MRLTCPNCGAQYEIDAEMIPEDGRDVQCSNCNHTWYEMPEGAEEEQPTSPPKPLTKAAAPKPEPKPEPAPPPQRPAAKDLPTEELPPISGEPASNLDPEIAAILREEAEHERTQRAREASSIESQPDLGLDVATAAVGADRPRRERLPDIEEINSSLREDGSDTAAAPKAERKGGGFWRGFWLVVVLAAIALAAYLFAPQIAARVPQLADPLAAYTVWVDGLRVWLDGVVGQLAPDNG